MGSVHPLKLAYAREHPQGLATFLAGQDQEGVLDGLEGLPPEVAVAVVASLPQVQAMRLLAGRDDEQVLQWLDAAPANHALALLLHLDEARRRRLLARVAGARKRRTLERLLLYPRSMVGALVDPTAMRLNADLQLAEAVSLMRDSVSGQTGEVWLVDADERYLGQLDLAAALVARSRQMPLRRLVRAVRSLQADTTLMNACEFTEWTENRVLPITDHQGRFLGAVTHQRLMMAARGLQPANQGLTDAVGHLARQYIRVLGLCLDGLLGSRGSKR